MKPLYDKDESLLKTAPPELVDLINRAIIGCKNRENEDVEEWAERIAKDVVNADD